MTPFQRWQQFVLERFEPISHSVMIGVFVLGHWLVASVFFASQELQSSGLQDGSFLNRVLFTLVFAFLFFFKLRLYDEVKDYDTDREFNPTRPLARGLLTVSSVQRGIAVVVLAECAVLMMMGSYVRDLGLIAIGYSLLMYREFFIGRWLRPKLTTYAVTHTIVCCFLSATLLAAIVQVPPNMWTSSHWLFVLSNWFLFNIFEFGRKTFASSEERERVPSYSKVFGRPGAVLLLFTQAAAASGFLAQALRQSSVVLSIVLVSLSLAVVVVGVLFVATDSPAWARRYRAGTSLYIVLVFLSLVSISAGRLLIKSN